jgi:cholesterol transport system auxiliary component
MSLCTTVRLTTSLLLVMQLTACGGLLKSTAPPEQLYVLRAAAAVAPTVAALPATLHLLPPVAQPGLDTARIALVLPGQRLDYYAGASWSGTLPDVAQSLLAQGLRDSGRFAQVNSDAAGMGADFVLAVTLRRFEAEYTAPGVAPQVEVQLDCTLSSRQEHRQVAMFSVRSSALADADRQGSVVAAFERAAQAAVAQLVERSAQAAAATLAATPPAPVAPARR